MSTLTITRGLPASGKTTWAKQYVEQDPASRVRINRDDYRAMMFGTPDYSYSQEQAVTTAQQASIKALLKSGRDVVADDMNLRPRYVRDWAKFARALGADFEVVEFAISVEESITRDAARPKPVGAEAINKMAEKFLRGGQLQAVPEEPLAAVSPQAYQPVDGTARAIIVDIDGTLALLGDRSPYDATRVSQDLPNWPVIEAVLAADQAGLQVIYCSGRQEIAREDTRAWLILQGLPEGPLFMRASQDSRKDAVVKQELFDDHIRRQYNIRYVLDDRQQVVDMWRALGLAVFQVAEGDF